MFRPLALSLVLVLALAVSAVAASLPKTTNERLLRIFNWKDYIDPDVLVEFSRATGVMPIYNEYDDNAIPDARLTRGKADFDLVSPTATPYMERQIKAGLYLPLDKSKIPNFKNLDPQLLKLVEASDPGNVHGIIYQWGTTGIVYNPAMVKAALPDTPVDSLDIVFNPDHLKHLQKCGVAMLDSPTEIMPLVFRYLKRSPDTEDPRDYIDAEAVMKSIRPYIKYFHSSRYVDDLADGRICIAIGWNGDVNLANDHARARQTKQVLEYAIPVEGTVVWFDMMAIPKTAKNSEAAHDFLNYILQPAVMGRISNKTGYANAVPASRPYLSESLNKNGVAYPSDAVMAKLFSIGDASPERTRALQQVWTRMRISQADGYSGNETQAATPALAR